MSHLSLTAPSNSLLQYISKDVPATDPSSGETETTFSGEPLLFSFSPLLHSHAHLQPQVGTTQAHRSLQTPVCIPTGLARTHHTPAWGHTQNSPSQAGLCVRVLVRQRMEVGGFKQNPPPNVHPGQETGFPFLL